MCRFLDAFCVAGKYAQPTDKIACGPRGTAAIRAELAGDSDASMTSSHQRDLFLSDPEPALFEEPADYTGRPDPEKIRLHLVTLLETARNAKTMPWPEREARMWQTTFPQLTNWLPPDEAA